MGQDNSPEGTASRIVSMSTAFFEAWTCRPAQKRCARGCHPQFVGLIRGGFVEQGFNEASDILNGLGVLGRRQPDCPRHQPRNL